MNPDAITAALGQQLSFAELGQKGCLSCSKTWQAQQGQQAQHAQHTAAALQQYWDGSLIVFSVPSGLDVHTLDVYKAQLQLQRLSALLR